MKGAFYDDIPAIQAAVTEVLKNIPINDIKQKRTLTSVAPKPEYSSQIKKFPYKSLILIGRFFIAAFLL